MTEELLKEYINSTYTDKLLIEQINSFSILDKTYSSISISKQSPLYEEAQEKGSITIKSIKVNWNGERLSNNKSERRTGNTIYFNHGDYVKWNRNRIINLVI